MPFRNRWTVLLSVLLAALLAGACGDEPHDLLIRGGMVHDGSGADPFVADVAIRGDRITFVGDADAEGVTAEETVDATGFIVAPGFIDMHSHSQIGQEWAKEALPFLYQGITTVVVGADGGGSPDVSDTLAGWEASEIGVNALTYVGHGAVRRRVLGEENRAPSDKELDRMRDLVRKGLEEGAFGLSSGLFYIPGNYATTEEVIELAKLAAGYEPGIYDTHDRDLGAAYPSFGYLASIEEAIRIGEESGTKVIFSHFNAQGAANYGRAPEGAAVIEAARERGVPVFGAQHVYTATQSSLRAYTVPRWASAGGRDAMLDRFDDPDTARVLDEATAEMLAIRGGPDKIRFSDPRPHLNGRTLADVAEEWGVPAPEAARRILSEGNASVMNVGLYDPVNTGYLAEQDWMMTCTDGRDIEPGTPRRPSPGLRRLHQETPRLRSRRGADLHGVCHPQHERPRRRIPRTGRPRFPPGGHEGGHRDPRSGADSGPGDVRRAAPVLRRNRPRSGERRVRYSRQRAHRGSGRAGAQAVGRGGRRRGAWPGSRRRYSEHAIFGGMEWTVETVSRADAEIEALPVKLRARLVRLLEAVENVGLEALREPHVNSLW